MEFYVSRVIGSSGHTLRHISAVAQALLCAISSSCLPAALRSMNAAEHVQRWNDLSDLVGEPSLFTSAVEWVGSRHVVPRSLQEAMSSRWGSNLKNLKQLVQETRLVPFVLDVVVCVCLHKKIILEATTAFPPSLTQHPVLLHFLDDPVTVDEENSVSVYRLVAGTSLEPSTAGARLVKVNLDAMFGWFVEEAEFVRRSQEDTEIALQEFQTQDTAVGLDEHAPFMDDIRPTRGQENEVKGKGTRFQQGSSREGQQVQHMSFADFTHSADMVNNVALTNFGLETTGPVSVGMPSRRLLVRDIKVMENTSIDLDGLRYVSGPRQGFTGLLRGPTLDDAVWSSAFKGRFDTPHTARWTQVDGQMRKISWKTARAPFGILEFGCGRMHCDAYFPSTEAQVTASGAALNESQRDKFQASLRASAEESEVLRLADRARGSSGSVTLSPDRAQDLFRRLSNKLSMRCPELADPVLVWQNYGQKLPMTSFHDVQNFIRDLRSTFSTTLIEENVTADFAIELEVGEGLVPLLDGPKLQSYLATWDSQLFGPSSEAPPWRTHCCLMLHQLLSCASAKFCQAPPSQQGRLASVPVLGKSKAFFQRLVLYNPAFRALSLGKEAFKYTDLLGETLSLFTLPGIGDWLRSENLLKEGHHAGKGTTYLKTVVEKIAVQLEQLLPTLGRKLRLEIEVPAYVAADIAPLLQSVLVGLVSSGSVVLVEATRVRNAMNGFVSACTFAATDLMHRVFPSAEGGAVYNVPSCGFTSGQRLWVQAVESFLMLLIEGTLGHVFCPVRGFRQTLYNAMYRTNLLHIPRDVITLVTDSSLPGLYCDRDVPVLPFLDGQVRRHAKYTRDVPFIRALATLVYNRTRETAGSFALQVIEREVYHALRAPESGYTPFVLDEYKLGRINISIRVEPSAGRAADLFFLLAIQGCLSPLTMNSSTRRMAIYYLKHGLGLDDRALVTEATRAFATATTKPLIPCHSLTGAALWSEVGTFCSAELESVMDEQVAAILAARQRRIASEVLGSMTTRKRPIGDAVAPALKVTQVLPSPQTVVASEWTQVPYLRYRARMHTEEWRHVIENCSQHLDKTCGVRPPAKLDHMVAVLLALCQARTSEVWRSEVEALFPGCISSGHCNQELLLNGLLCAFDPFRKQLCIAVSTLANKRGEVRKNLDKKRIGHVYPSVARDYKFDDDKPEVTMRIIVQKAGEWYLNLRSTYGMQTAKWPLT